MPERMSQYKYKNIENWWKIPIFIAENNPPLFTNKNFNKIDQIESTFDLYNQK